ARAGQRGARGRGRGGAQQAARERLARDEVHDEERRAEDGRVLLAPAHARHAQPGRVRRGEEGELVAPARVHVVPGRIAAQHEALDAAARQHGIEGPYLARRAAGQAVQLLDRDRLGAEPARDVAGEPLGELGRRDPAPPQPAVPSRSATPRWTSPKVANSAQGMPRARHQSTRLPPRRAKTTSATAAGSRSEKPSPTRIVRRPSARALRRAAALSCPWGESSRKRHSQVPGRKRLARTSCTGAPVGPRSSSTISSKPPLRMVSGTACAAHQRAKGTKPVSTATCARRSAAASANGA